MKADSGFEMKLPHGRRSFRPLLPEIDYAAALLSGAADAHLRGDSTQAASLIKDADMPVLREWLESIWGKGSPHIHFRQVADAPAAVDRSSRVEARMPDAKAKRLLIERDGHRCRLCGILVIRSEVRQFLKIAYPDVLHWGNRNIDQHAAFQVMWLQYDHLLPHARGGSNDLENMLIACASCNFGRMNYTLEEVGFAPLGVSPDIASPWDGLERVLSPAKRISGVTDR
jgi:hypothetical protein